ncbi:MAG TPA: tetratricopeptide repeat protein, partial [Allosphingosinicella sp.]|nr:tetratricopeptide repeat protein [Allosphingosinicella sp.]
MSDDRPTLERAVALARAGDGAAARREAEAALAADPGNGGLLHFLGTLHCQAGAFAEGAGYFRRVVERDPDASAARADLARALLALGQSEEALLACATGGPELRRLEGQILQSLGRDAEAAAAYEQVVGQMPRDWEIWNNLGNTRQALGDAAGAVAALEEAARIRPDVLPIQVNFGAALAAAGQLEEALRAYSAALTLAPAELPIRLEAARLQRQLGRGEAALQLLENAPAGAEVAVERARSLTALRRLDAAEQAYREAIGARPGWAEAYLELGIALERSGRVEALAPLLAEAAAQGVAAEALSYLHALLLQSQGRVEEALEWAQRVPPALEPVRTQRLISRLAAQAGQSALAFAAAGRANALAARDWRAALERAAAYRAHVGRLTQIVTDSWVARWTPPVPAGERPSPVFLVGFPRSGTTLLDTILMGHGQTHVLEEIPLLERVMAQVGGMERLA